MVASDDWDEIIESARKLSARGFTVWINDHGHESPLSSASDLRVVVHLDPGESPEKGIKAKAARRRSPAATDADRAGRSSGPVLLCG